MWSEQLPKLTSVGVYSIVTILVTGTTIEPDSGVDNEIEGDVLSIPNLTVLELIADSGVPAPLSFLISTMTS